MVLEALFPTLGNTQSTISPFLKSAVADPVLKYNRSRIPLECSRWSSGGLSVVTAPASAPAHARMPANSTLQRRTILSYYAAGGQIDQTIATLQCTVFYGYMLMPLPRAPCDMLY